MHIWNSLTLMDKINTAVSLSSVIVAVFASISTILYAVSCKKRYKKASVISTGLTAIVAIIYYFSNDRLSDLRKAKEKYDSIKLANYSTAISKTSFDNKELRAKMDHTEKVLAPPSISLESKKIEHHSQGICAKLRFKSSKIDSLPALTFKMKIIEGDSKIMGFDLDIDSPIHQNRNSDNFPKISEDGKTATVNFYTINSTKADIRIDVSAPAKAIITGKYIDSPVTITIP